MEPQRGKFSTKKRRERYNPYRHPPSFLACCFSLTPTTYDSELEKLEARSAVAGGGGRPPPPDEAAPPRSPSWLSRLLSSFFDSDSDSSSASDDAVNRGNGRDGILNGTNMSNMEAERKDFIKQLLLQETFSREECDMFVKIIRSRVPEHSFVDRVEMVGSALIPGRSILNVTPDHAVMEAKKFLEEKKAGQSLLQHVESDAGSPVDMAKSYMQSRPPWASPSTGHFKLGTPPSTMLTHLTSEEILHSRSKERKYLASGDWNMQEEIRRVCSKATEDMLRPSSSLKDTKLSSRNGSKGAEVTETALPLRRRTVFHLHPLG